MMGVEQDHQKKSKKGEGYGFELAQVFGSAALFASGLLTGNDARTAAGAANLAKNIAWLSSKYFKLDISSQRWLQNIIQNGDNPLDKKGRASRSHETLSGISSISSGVQFTGGVLAIGSGTLLEVSLDIAMGGAGAFAYLLIAMERHMTNKRLQALREKKLLEAGGDEDALKDISDEELLALEDLSDKPLLDFAYNKLPGTLLAIRGLAMLGYGVVGIVMGTVALPLAIPLIIAGACFAYGGLKDFVNQNPEGNLKKGVDSVENAVSRVGGSLSEGIRGVFVQPKPHIT